MAKKLYPEENIQAIANAIRTKNGSSDTYTIGEMAQAIEDIPSGIAEFDTSGTTFNGIQAITSIKIPDNATSIGDSAFYNCSGLTSIDIPDSVTSIGSKAFTYCSGLTSIDIPDSVTSIESSAFYNCTSLVSVDLPDRLTSINASTFQLCSELTSIDIPDGVTSISSGAFYQCSKLASITCRATTPPTIQANTFYSVPATAKIYVPAESVEAYKAAANWSARASYIRAIPSEG